MIRRLGTAMGALLAAVVVTGDGDAAVTDPQVMELLSGIDFVPAKSDLDGALADPNADLIAIAEDTAVDSGLRMRALWALGNYPGQDTENALDQMIDATEDATAGTDLMLLRASMYSLADVAPAPAVARLAPLLEHPARDVRADAALALGRTGQPSAIPHLRERLNAEEDGVLVEQQEQVRWALSEAIRSLSGM